MTIKEVENLLDIPRATVRYYEKEGLISPERVTNGYREYSEVDVEKIKQIIIFRKIGLSVNDIEDIFDGVKTMQEVLEANTQKLQKQMEELRGAMNLCLKLQKDNVDIQTIETEKYWNTIEEEEKKGNLFIDIAKDIVDIEKDIVLSHFSSLDSEGNPYASVAEMVRNGIILGGTYGCIKCLVEQSWNLKNFVGGLILLIATIITEGLLSIPIYLLGRRFKWIEKHRKLTLFITALVLMVLVILLI